MKTATAPLPPLRSVKVLDQLRERIRYLHYSLRTEQAYVNWVRAFIRFHGVRHPATLGSSEVEAFLSWLANERKVSVSTHRQALAALLFFYGKVLCTDLPWLQEIGRPRPSRRLPVVLTPDEVVRILGFLEGEHRLFAQDSSYSSSGWLLIGCIDVGRVGIADRYQDLAILWNCLGEFSPSLQKRLFQKYGIDNPDMNKLQFHLMLDEFF